MRPFLTLVPLLLLLLFPRAAHADGGLELDPPVPGAVLKSFSTGPERWSPGHRGVDLAGRAGEEVRAAAVGVVFFAGSVAGRPSVSVDHGNGLRTTYTPVRGSVAKGDVVAAGDVVGTLAPGHCASACLHWGLTDGTDHFDPLAYTGVRQVRLLPVGSAARPSPQFRAATTKMSAGNLPVKGRISSRFGMRTHPVTGVHKLHDGVDIATGCGQPVVTPWTGTVTTVQHHPAYGNRVIIEHADGLSAYAHLQKMSVRKGQRLQAGTPVGTVGSTGLSTGCHLHWMAWTGGRLVDPLTLVGSR
ncbi:peptidoglycan DD-metalloendopeptidase family protein [Tessaracoccus sp. OS52]|uniref:peptidoglycan DD-metalloendopeptidase family protein n=1 Tax=Tessaracoccus sp. OS52 TaxID=2886691 RepID=UPI001D0FB0D2|nr:peptidoglycan DD-metalloendopeptidase family protein [Tessaracoccus sp. OS52]MCC2593313.1 peptidoglycan DD-metalloendopeptidase family protein [Tessaracoccus sp. OS52]